MTAGEVSDETDAMVLLGRLPKAEWLWADRGYDADWFRDVLKEKVIKPCIPAGSPDENPSNTTADAISATTALRSCSRTLKDWRRIATRYDRCPKVFLSAIALAMAECLSRTASPALWCGAKEGNKSSIIANSTKAMSQQRRGEDALRNDFRVFLGGNGAPGGTRTPDLLITNEAHYQLCYWGKALFPS